MKSYKDMTYRYLRGQKNRTLLTIIGIIISVAMVSAIGTMLVSAKEATIKNNINLYGSYHGSFSNLDNKIVEKLKMHLDVSEVGLTQDQDYGVVTKTSEHEREVYHQNMPYRYIDIKAYDKKALDLLPINLVEGRLPESSKEIIIEKWMADYFENQAKIGDTIKLKVGQRDIEYEKGEGGYETYLGENFSERDEKEYKLAGFIEPNYIYKGNFITQGIIGLDGNLFEDTPYTAYFKLNAIKDANKKIETIGNNLGLDKKQISSNNKVLRLYAESIKETFNKSVIATVAFLIILTMISTIAVIYNSFSISVVERISQFGLLRSIGASPNQIRNLVLREAAILSIISIPIGLVSGVLAMKIVFYIIATLISGGAAYLNDIKIIFSPSVFLITGIISVLTVFLSAIGPAKQAAKISPLEAVRNTGELKEESFKKIRSSKLVRILLGVEGEIARKNLRRNRKRFLITVFSMVLSIALFITFSTFSDFMFKLGGIAGYEEGTDFGVFGSIENTRLTEIVNTLEEMDDVSRAYNIKETHGDVRLKEEQISHKLLEMHPYLLKEKEEGLVAGINAELISIGDKNFELLKNLLISGSNDVERLNQENGVLVINNHMATKPSGGKILMEGFKLKVGDSFEIQLYETENDENDIYSELKVMGVLEKGILGDPYNRDSGLRIITTEEVWEKVYKEANPDETYRFANLNVKMAEDGSREDVFKYLEGIDENTPGFYLIDMVETAKQMRQTSIIMSIFLYGFVSLIVLIATINIINTISTNILLRTKEIAMIKAVGMSQAGIKKMVALESIFYGWYASIFGGLAGLGLTYTLFRLMGGISEFEYKLPWANVLVACFAAIIISLFSGAYPLKRINDNIIVESIRGNN